jgi:hypothetical protein
MYAQMIQNLDPKHIDEDTLSGMKMMLDLDSFSDIHDLVKSKIQEVEDHKKQETQGFVGGFAMAVGKYYRTVNSSLVHCYEECLNDDGMKLFKMIILSGGFDTKEPQSFLSALSGSNFKVYSGYFVNEMGQNVMPKYKSDPKFAMHIVKEIEVNFPY